MRLGGVGRQKSAFHQTNEISARRPFDLDRAAVATQVGNDRAGLISSPASRYLRFIRAAIVAPFLLPLEHRELAFA